MKKLKETKFSKLPGGFNVLSQYKDTADIYIAAREILQEDNVNQRSIYLVWGQSGLFYHSIHKTAFPSLDEAKSDLDKFLLELGFILCDTQEEFEKYRSLL